MSAKHTVFIRSDNQPREGCACVASAVVYSGDGARAYMGEVRGSVAVVDALHRGVLLSPRNAWAWAKRKGYTRPVESI